MTVFVVLRGDRWAVRTENSERVYKVFDTQDEAMRCGIEIAKNNHAELRVQDRNGKFRVCNSYGEESKIIDKNR